MKQAKYGILNRMAYESKRGYIYNFKLYAGKAVNCRILSLKVLAPYLNNCYKVYADNFYNRVNLTNLLIPYENQNLWYRQEKSWSTCHAKVILNLNEYMKISLERASITRNVDV